MTVINSLRERRKLSAQEMKEVLVAVCDYLDWELGTQQDVCEFLEKSGIVIDLDNSGWSPTVNITTAECDLHGIQNLSLFLHRLYIFLTSITQV